MQLTLGISLAPVARKLTEPPAGQLATWIRGAEHNHILDASVGWLTGKKRLDPEAGKDLMRPVSNH